MLRTVYSAGNVAECSVFTRFAALNLVPLNCKKNNVISSRTVSSVVCIYASDLEAVSFSTVKISCL